MAQTPKTALTRRPRRTVADFFISYTWSDLATAKVLRDWLETAGHSTLMQERDFVTGGHIPTMIEEGLKAKQILAVMSEAYLKSQYCKAELGAAIHRDPINTQLRMVIVRISACEVPELLAPISRIELVGKSGENTKAIFLECIQKLKPSKRAFSKPGSPKPVASAPPSIGGSEGPKATVHGDGSFAFVGDHNKIYMPGEPRKRGRAKPPADVVSEDQAVKLKTLINEIMALDDVSYGKDLSTAQLRQKWWGALEKVVPKTTYTNYSQSKFQKAMKWLREQRARLLVEVADEKPGLSRDAHIRTIHTLLSNAGIKDAQQKKRYYADLSERLVSFLPSLQARTFRMTIYRELCGRCVTILRSPRPSLALSGQNKRPNFSMEKIKIRTVYEVISERDAKHILAVTQRVDMEPGYENGVKVENPKLRTQEAIFQSTLAGTGIRLELVRGEDFDVDPKIFLKKGPFDLAVLMGEVTSQSIRRAKQLLTLPFKRPLCIEITKETVQNPRELKIVESSVQMHGAPELLRELVYLSNSPSARKYVEFDIPRLEAPLPTAVTEKRRCRRSLQNAPPLVTSKCTTFGRVDLVHFGRLKQGIVGGGGAAILRPAQRGWCCSP